jgi:hypothetical protein
MVSEEQLVGMVPPELLRRNIMLNNEIIEQAQQL